jgi:hypothetical protein
LLARQGNTALAAQQAKVSLQPMEQFFEGKEPDARHRQFNCQRDAVQAVAKPRYVLRILGSERKGGHCFGHTVHKQAKRIVLQQVLRRREAMEVWQGERRHDPEGLSGDLKRFSTCSHNAQLRGSMQQRCCQSRAGINQVFAVVQHQQEAPCPKIVYQTLGQGSPRLLTQAYNPSHRLRDKRRVAEGCQFNEPRGTAKILSQISRCFYCQSGFPTSTGASEC